MGKCCQVVIFGELRTIEREHIVERLPIFVINLLLNLTTGDNNMMLNIFLISVSVLSKILHSILIDRLEFQHMKIVNDLNTRSYDYATVMRIYGKNSYLYWNMMFFGVDFLVAKFLVYDVFQGINSVTCLLFGFQFAELGLETLLYFLKSVLNIYELAFYPNYDTEDEFDLDNVPDFGDDGDGEGTGDDEEREKVWDNKGLYVKSLEITTSILKVGSYVSFIYLLSYHTGLSVPFSMLQGLYLSVRKAYQQFKQLMTFLESAKRLDSQLLDASADDLATGDNLCIICRDDMCSVVDYEAAHGKKMPARKKPKKLLCGHILHIGCLKDWLERSESCPLCRRPVFGSQPEAPPTEPVPPAEPGAVPHADPRTEPTDTPTPAPTPTQNPNAHPSTRRFQDFNERLRRHRENTTSPPTQTTPIETAPPTSTQEPEISTQEPETSTRGTEPETEPEPETETEPRPTISRAGDGFQHMALPTNSILPPNWTILPVRSSTIQGVNYQVNLSEVTTVNLTVKERRTGGELNLIDPNFSRELRRTGPGSNGPGNSTDESTTGSDEPMDGPTGPAGPRGSARG